MDSTPYIGRFAPTPSGALHFGSLVAALASYLDARAHHGIWRVRMEDIDPPREQPGASADILKTLDAYGLHWDGPVLYQSQRQSAYLDALAQLRQRDLLYPCFCTRRQLAGLDGVYPGYCRGPNLPARTGAHALRLKCSDRRILFQDRIQGAQSFQLADLGDFVLQRKDGLFAYQLAVCVDDHYQGITHIVRGYDLLDSTPRQYYLQTLLGYRHPYYAHIPVITQRLGGDKLSKQNHARPLEQDNPAPLLVSALRALGLQPDEALSASPVADILGWGVAHWRCDTVPPVAEIPLDTLL